MLVRKSLQMVGTGIANSRSPQYLRFTIDYLISFSALWSNKEHSLVDIYLKYA